MVAADAELDAPGPGPGGDTARRRTAAQPVGRRASSCATARSSARAPPSRPAAPTPRSRPCGPPATAPAAPPPTSPSSRARTTGARRRAPTRWSTPASPGSWSRSRTPTPASPGAGIAQLRDRGITVDVGVGADDAARVARAVPAPPPPRRAFTRGEDRHEPRRPHRGGRRLVAVDHRRRSARRRARVCGPSRRPSSSAPAPRSPTARRLTARDVEPPGRPPAAAGAARRHRPGRRPTARCSTPTLAPTLVVTTDAAPDDAPTAWLAAGAKVADRRRRRRTAPASTSPPRSRCSPGLGVLQALVEGGAALAGALVDAGLADRLVTYVAPTVLGRDGLPALDFAGPATHRRRAALAARSTSPASAPTSASTTSRRPWARASLMFTGIVEELGTRAGRHRQRGWRAHRDRRARRVLDDAEIGASIAVNGCCLTVVELGRRLVGRRRGHRDPRPHVARRARAPATR